MPSNLKFRLTQGPTKLQNPKSAFLTVHCSLKVSDRKATLRVGEGGGVTLELRKFFKERTRVQRRGWTRKEWSGDPESKSEEEKWK